MAQWINPPQNEPRKVNVVVNMNENIGSFDISDSAGVLKVLNQNVIAKPGNVESPQNDNPKQVNAKSTDVSQPTPEESAYRPETSTFSSFLPKNDAIKQLPGVLQNSDPEEFLEDNRPQNNSGKSSFIGLASAFVKVLFEIENVGQWEVHYHDFIRSGDFLIFVYNKSGVPVPKFLPPSMNSSNGDPVRVAILVEKGDIKKLFLVYLLGISFDYGPYTFTLFLIEEEKDYDKKGKNFSSTHATRRREAGYSSENRENQSIKKEQKDRTEEEFGQFRESYNDSIDEDRGGQENQELESLDSSINKFLQL